MLRRTLLILSLWLVTAGVSAQVSAVRLGPRSIDLPTPITFEPGAPPVLTPEGEALLRRVVQILLSNPSVTIEIGAHTDSTGGEAFNQATSQARAEVVRAFLLANGVAAGRVRAVGYGETVPIDSSSTAAGRLRNRRIELTRTDVP